MEHAVYTLVYIHKDKYHEGSKCSFIASTDMFLRARTRYNQNSGTKYLQKKECHR
jgi:hypothetical protein